MSFRSFVLTRFSLKLALALLCLPAVSATAQTSRITLDASETIFSVVAAIRNCGYDAGSTDPFRAQVSGEVAKAVGASPEAQAASAEMCTFYRDHRQADSARDLAQYMSLALFLGDAPKFTVKAQEADLPPDASYVLGFVPLLAHFAEASHLHQIWQEHRYQYDDLIARFHDPVSKMILATDLYLRLPLSGYQGRAFTVYLEPLAASGQVNARNYGTDYFMVVSPAGSNLRIDQIRHTYLHFIFDPLLLKRANTMKRVEPILKTVQKAPLDVNQKKDVSLLLTESMIRAVEARLAASGRDAEPMRQREADKAMSEGYILTRYFYDQLAKFENEPAGLSEALPDWLYYLDVGRETKRAESVKFAPAAAPEVLSASGPKAGLLDLAEQRLDAGDYDGAHKLAERALDQKMEDSGRALFILARAASLNKDMPGARHYFERTVQAASDPRLRAWAHVYLGRIADIQEDRPAAVEHYKAALAVAGIPADTRAAAERGLQQPYEPQRP
jgi:tetratricopeptide (TPR) repeat protein